MDKLICNRLIPIADGSFCITSVEQHTLTIEENGVVNSISIDRATHAACNNTNASIGKILFLRQRKNR